MTDRAEDAVADPEETDEKHLDEIDDGAGCAEIWEHLSERRERTGADD